MFNARQHITYQTWLDIDGTRFGAQADDRGPIGGGTGYTLYPEPTYPPVTTLNQLLERLGHAKPGDVIAIDGQAVIDCTERVYIEKLVIEVPEGVTLASDRGQGNSSGGMLCSDTFETRPLIQITGPDARITGLRIKGPNPKRCMEHHHRSFAEKRGHEYYYKFPTSAGIITSHENLEVDNCELAGWSGSAINIRTGRRHRIHHNFIHHNQYNGLGYGVSHDKSYSQISYNLFNYNRHSIAGTGRSGCGYEACHNVEMGTSLSHCFDMHGGRDRKDGTELAGDKMRIHHNTFRCPKKAVIIRGVPASETELTHNWFYHASPEKSVRYEDQIRFGQNAYGIKSPVVK